MSATVRSPEGHAYTYNDVKHLDRTSAEYTDLRDRSGGSLIAQVPKTWLIEYVSPCVIRSRPSTSEGALDELLNNQGEALRKVPQHKIAHLKKLLAKFNRQTHRWSE